MATHGTGAFSSDGAADFLDELAERPAADRPAALGHLFGVVREHPDRLGRDYFPDQIVAAAAVVAATLPGGDAVADELAYRVDAELVDDARLDRPVPELAAAALTALRSVAGPGGAWHQGWVIEADAAEARQTTDALARVLGVAAGA